MDVDVIGADGDPLDQSSKEGTLAWSGQLGPALPDFRGARDSTGAALMGRKAVSPDRCYRIDKPLVHSAGHHLLDLPAGMRSPADGSV
jgi:hypothetical protein